MLTPRKRHQPGQNNADHHKNRKDPEAVEGSLAVSVLAGDSEHNRGDQGEKKRGTPVRMYHFVCCQKHKAMQSRSRLTFLADSNVVCIQDA